MTDEIALTGIILLILLLDFFGVSKKLIGFFFTLAVATLLVYVIADRKTGAILNGAFVYDGISWFSKIIFLSGAVITGLLSIDTIKVKERHAGAYYAILGASTLGMMVLASSMELVTMYVGLELATISLYALSAIYKKDDRSLEAGIKYLILGALSSGILLYGISLVYGAAGTTYIGRILAISPQLIAVPLFIIAVIFILLGIGFKLSMVPMHVWTPDVYQGAPTPITGFISVASKAAGFIFAIRIFTYAFMPLNSIWVPIVSVIAFFTMTIGNLAAIPQKNLKRMLAYSTISQAGYLLVGFVGASVTGVSSVLFYLFIYTFTNLAAFGVLVVFSNKTGSDELDDYAGLAQREPLLALVFMLALLSLAGIPPMAGFAGKFYLFYSAMQEGYLWLVIAGALNSTISLYYYLLILKRMYILDPNKDKPMPKIKLPITAVFALIISIAVILLFGIFPAPVINLTNTIAQGMFK